jgi:hypothetical protein
MKVITMTAWRRPDYFDQVLTALESCTGSEDYKVLVQIDGGYPYAQEIMEDRCWKSPLNVIAVAEINNIGCAGNTHKALSRGFAEHVDWVIHLEDDTLPSKDFLVYMEENLTRYQTIESIFSIAGYQGTHDRDWVTPWFDDDAESLGVATWFTCWGWGTWRRIWDQLDEGWFGINWNDKGVTYRQTHGNSPEGTQFLECITKTPKGSWAQPMNHYWRDQIGSPYEIKPAVSRIQNIGVEEGVFTTPEYNLAMQNTPNFIEDLVDEPDYPLDHDFIDLFLSEQL